LKVIVGRVRLLIRSGRIQDLFIAHIFREVRLRLGVGNLRYN